jgi:Fe2+ or Zn2+ uptake regulation protein
MLKGIPEELARPARALLTTIMKKNKTKAFYANELYEYAKKISPSVSYQSIISALKEFNFVKLYGDYRRVYGHPTMLNKVKRSEATSPLENKYAHTSLAMLVLKMFNKYKKRLFSPAELFKELKKQECDVTYGGIKRAMNTRFTRIVLSPTVCYYGHASVLKKYERYLKQNGVNYSIIKPKRKEE